MKRKCTEDLDDSSDLKNLEEVLIKQIDASNDVPFEDPENRYPNLTDRVIEGKRGFIKIISQIGSPGAFGCGWEAEVYGDRICTQSADPKHIFVKTFYHKLKADDRNEYAARVNRELHVAMKFVADVRLVHPNVIQYFESCRSAPIYDATGHCLGNIAFLATELCEGGQELLDWWVDWETEIESHLTNHGSLDDAVQLKAGLNHDGVARHFFKQIINGLAHAHSCGAVHYDLKLENIMVVPGSNDAKVVDFGLGKKLETADQREHSIKQRMPNYIAPEARHVERGDITCPESVDIWSCGNILLTLTCYRSARQEKVSWETALKKVCRVDQGWTEHLDEIVRVGKDYISNGRILVSRFDSGLHPDGPDLKNLLSGMLRKEPEDRLKFQEVLAHPWLQLQPTGCPPSLHSMTFLRSLHAAGGPPPPP